MIAPTRAYAYIARVHKVSVNIARNLLCVILHCVQNDMIGCDTHTRFKIFLVITAMWISSQNCP